MISDPYIEPTMQKPMFTSPMVMNPSVSNHVLYTIYLVNMHNTNILGEYNICHLLHPVIQFCEVVKHGNISFVLMFKRDNT